jgi:ABC-type spermidine/putrescine transport system permease subunit I
MTSIDAMAAPGTSETLVRTRELVRRREALKRTGLLTPALLIIVVFGIFPLFIVLFYSFLEAGAYGGVEWKFSTEAYVTFLFNRDLFDPSVLHFSSSYLQIFARSFIVAAVATVVCLLVALGLLYAFLPFMVLPLYASLEKIDFRLVEAGFDLYATRGQVLRRIIIPLAKPGIIAGCILVFIPGLGAYITPALLGGGRDLMIGNLIAQQFAGSRNWPFGSAMALILMAVVLVFLMIYASVTGRQKTGHG